MKYTTIRDCRYGPMMFLTNDKYLGRYLEIYREFSESEIDLFRQIVRPGMAVMDIGANIGYHTVFLGQHVGPQGRVFAFEPQRIISNILHANIALNELQNCWAHNIAIGDDDGKINVPKLNFSQVENFGGLSLRDFQFGEEVQQIALDNWFMDKKIDFMKIDVEGMESEVLLGAAGLIHKSRPVLYVENDRREKSSNLIYLLNHAGYNLWWHVAPLFNEKNFACVKEDVISEHGESLMSINMLAIPKETPSKIGLPAVASSSDWPL